MLVSPLSYWADLVCQEWDITLVQDLAHIWKYATGILEINILSESKAGLVLVGFHVQCTCDMYNMYTLHVTCTCTLYTVQINFL